MTKEQIEREKIEAQDNLKKIKSKDARLVRVEVLYNEIDKNYLIGVFFDKGKGSKLDSYPHTTDSGTREDAEKVLEFYKP